MGPRRYDPEGTRQALLDAARAVFIEKGVAQASMNDIARRAEVTKSLIHHHFGSKDELWRAVKQHSFEAYFEGLLAILEGEQADLACLTAAVRFMFRFYGEEPDVARLMTLIHLEADPECADDPLVCQGVPRRPMCTSPQCISEHWI